MTDRVYWFLPLLALLSLGVLGCRPKATPLASKPSEEQIVGRWQSDETKGRIAEISFFQDGSSAIRNLPVFVPATDAVQVVSGAGQWEVIQQAAPGGRDRWAIMLRISSVKMRLPLHPVETDKRIVLEYSDDPDEPPFVFSRIVESHQKSETP